MGKGQAIAGFVCAIVGLVFGFIPGVFAVLGLPIAIVGLVLSVIGGKKLKANNQPNGIATAGMVVGIIATVITAITFFACGICVLVAVSVL